jgi:hypothetical protein
MRGLLLWLIIGSIGVASGMAILTNTIDIDAQEMGVFFIPCEDHSENCKKILPTVTSDPSSTVSESSANPWAAQREYTSMVVSDEFEKQKTESLELVDTPIVLEQSILDKGKSGCTVGFWIMQDSSRTPDDPRLTWPSGYLPGDKFSSPLHFNTNLTITDSDDPSLIEALNAQGEGTNKLARHSVAALLNAAANPHVNYPLTVDEVISLTNEAITTSDYSVADKFAEYNNLGNSKFCS